MPTWRFSKRSRIAWVLLYFVGRASTPQIRVNVITHADFFVPAKHKKRMKKLYFGDNLVVLRTYIKDVSKDRKNYFFKIIKKLISDFKILLFQY